MRRALLLPLACLCLFTVVGCRPTRQLVAREEVKSTAQEVARDSVTTRERAMKGMEVEWWGSPMPTLPTPPTIPLAPMSAGVALPTEQPTSRGGYRVRVSEEAQVSAQRSEAHALESQHLSDSYADNYLLQREKSTGKFCLGIYFGLGLGLLVALLVIGAGWYVKRWISNHFFINN